MMPPMPLKQRLLGLVFAALSLLATPAALLAQEDEDIVDARLEGYAGGKTLPGGGQAMIWIACILLSVIAAAGLFKDAKRSHLD